jgi:hypothetical protein
MTEASRKTTILKYASGTVGVCVNKTPAGDFYYFYDDTSPPTLLSSFNSRGVGFVNFAGGRNAPRFSSTAKAGVISDEEGGTVERFDWEPKRPSARFGISKPAKLVLNSSLTFHVVDKHDLRMQFRGERGYHEFQVRRACTGGLLRLCPRSLARRFARALLRSPPHC